MADTAPAGAVGVRVAAVSRRADGEGCFLAIDSGLIVVGIGVHPGLSNEPFFTVNPRLNRITEKDRIRPEIQIPSVAIRCTTHYQSESES